MRKWLEACVGVCLMQFNWSGFFLFRYFRKKDMGLKILFVRNSKQDYLLGVNN